MSGAGWAYAAFPGKYTGAPRGAKEQTPTRGNTVGANHDGVILPEFESVGCPVYHRSMAEQIAIKSPAKKSEVWLSVITAIGAVVTAYTSHIQGAATYIAIAACLLLTGVYAFFKTPLASSDGRPGVKSKAFWVSIIVVLGSLAAAFSELKIPGVPAKVAQALEMIPALVTAAGYNIWRYQKKTVKTS